MQTYTTKEAAKKVNVPPRIIKQWEKELDGFFYIPRTKQGARIYTEEELQMLRTLKDMYGKKTKKEEIKLFLKKAKQKPESPQNSTEQSNVLLNITVLLMKIAMKKNKRHLLLSIKKSSKESLNSVLRLNVNASVFSRKRRKRTRNLLQYAQ
jgi:DNA-binding transcriptional MerR regulator